MTDSAFGPFLIQHRADYGPSVRGQGCPVGHRGATLWALDATSGRGRIITYEVGEGARSGADLVLLEEEMHGFAHEFALLLAGALLELLEGGEVRVRDAAADGG